MKHNPIALGFAAFAAMSLTVACNVDPNRVDKDVDNTIRKKECAAPNALSTAGINENRRLKKTNMADHTVRSVMVSKGQFNFQPEAELVEAKSETEKVSQKSSEISVDLQGCIEKGEDGYATISLPASIVGEDAQPIHAKVTDVETHKLEMVEDNGTQWVLESKGIDQNMSELADEDGINQIRLTRTTADGQVTVYISDSVEQAGDILVLNADDLKLMSDKSVLSPTNQKVLNSVTTQAGVEMDAVTGEVRMTVEEAIKITNGE